MGLFDFLSIAKVQYNSDNHSKTKYSPEVYNQDPNKSIIGETGKYDMSRLSGHEDFIIKSAINITNKKYPSKYRLLGLFNEAYVITYKPRYILMRIVEILGKSSQKPIDKLACALAMGDQGASRRECAISLFENSYYQIPKLELVQFDTIFPLFLLTKFSELYEKEHEYIKSAALLKELLKYGIGNKEYFIAKIDELNKKQRNWKPVRKRKASAEQVQFDQSVEAVALEYKDLLKYY